MKTMEWRFPELKKELKKEGVWQEEPDKKQWVDPDTGLPCMIVRSDIGALCGYVGVPPGHPWHGKDYQDIDVDVHGSLTYSEHCFGRVCHEREAGDPEVWWLGFDCCHARDFAPLKFGMDCDWNPDTSYRDFEYVESEVEKLAKQAAKAEGRV